MSASAGKLRRDVYKRQPELPPQGFYNAGQKLVAIIAVLCSLGLALTGLILVFASGRPGTEGLLQICLLAHFCLSLIHILHAPG